MSDSSRKGRKRHKPEQVIAKLRESEAMLLKELERENAWLKKLMAGLSLDKAILKEALDHLGNG